MFRGNILQVGFIIHNYYPLGKTYGVCCDGLGWTFVTNEERCRRRDATFLFCGPLCLRCMIIFHKARVSWRMIGDKMNYLL